MSSSGDGEASWTFLTAHARVLIMVARDPDLRVRDLAAACQVTERTVQGIVTDLEQAGYLIRTRAGRRNRYQVLPGKHFRHPAESDQEVAGLVALMLGRVDRNAEGPGSDHQPG